MCGIAGIIHRDGSADIGDELTTMLQSMKHRGPDSTGYAMYGQPDDLVVVRFMLALGLPKHPVRSRPLHAVPLPGVLSAMPQHSPANVT